MRKELTQRQRDNLENKRRDLVDHNNYSMTATLCYEHEMGIVTATEKWNKKNPEWPIVFNDKTGFYE